MSDKHNAACKSCREELQGIVIARDALRDACRDIQFALDTAKDQPTIAARCQWIEIEVFNILADVSDFT